MKHKTGLGIALWVILVVVTGVLAFGHGYVGTGYGSWHGWSHMGGWDGRNSTGGIHGWSGMLPWTMDGAPMGHDRWMANPYSMVPFLPQNLTEEQAKKFNQLHDEAASVNRSLMQQRWEVQTRLGTLYASEKRDWNAIRAAALALSDLQRQQTETIINMQQKVDGMLTAEQRQQLSSAWRSDGWQ